MPRMIYSSSLGFSIYGRNREDSSVVLTLSVPIVCFCSNLWLYGRVSRKIVRYIKRATKEAKLFTQEAETFAKSKKMLPLQVHAWFCKLLVVPLHASAEKLQGTQLLVTGLLPLTFHLSLVREENWYPEFPFT